MKVTMKSGWVVFTFNTQLSKVLKAAILNTLFSTREAVNKEHGMYKIPNGLLSVTRNRIEFKLEEFKLFS